MKEPEGLELEKLLEAMKDYQMTREDFEAFRLSFVHGNLAIENHNSKRKIVARKLKSDE